MSLYDGYAERIYNWLRETFWPAYQDDFSVLLSNLSDIVELLRYGLYVGVFAVSLFFVWRMIRPLLYKV